MTPHFAYGLDIGSEIALPELCSGGSGGDVTIRFGRADLDPDQETRSGENFEATTNEVRLAYEGVGSFLVREGHEIVIEPAAEVEESVLRLYLLGAALGVLLQQRGFLVLHASAIAVDGWAIAFLGGPRWGKSTTAAALCARGHALIADDVLPVSVGSEVATVLPGFPQLKLWPDVATMLGHSPDRLPQIHPELEKRGLRTAGELAADPLLLSRVYVLSVGDQCSVHLLGPADGVIELVRHSYAAALLDARTRPLHLRQCAGLARLTGIRRLERPPTLECLEDLADLVEKDCLDAVETPSV